MPRIKPTIDEAIKLASKHSGKCLSSQCAKSTDKLMWECKYNHKWLAQYRSVKSGRWCRQCAFFKRRTPINEIEQFVLENFNGKCITKSYKNNQTKMLWECEFGHQWEATYGNIKQHKKWCPFCAKNAKLSIEKMQKIALSRGGKCLSLNYINNHTKLLWMCFIGHRWSARPNDIIQKGRWCPFCNLSLGERCCKLIFEKSLGYEFKKIRPAWLKNKNGNNLELDGYCAELNMAFEYNGKYHDEIVFSFHDEDSLNKIKENDATKKTICEKLGMNLFVINEPTPFTIENIIKNIQKVVNFDLNTDIKNIELEVYAYNKLDKYSSIAKEKGGKCLSTTWVNSQHKTAWQCKHNHIWEATPNAIKQGQWCPQCNGNKKSTINECKKIANSRGGKCLSEKYKNQHTKMLWQCANNHIWRATLSSLKHNKTWCPKCRKKK